ncbi:hypothetical protein [Petrotoga sp. DB-2]
MKTSFEEGLSINSFKDKLMKHIKKLYKTKINGKDGIHILIVGASK